MVTAEFQMSIQDDTDRIQQLLCSIANPDHPFAKFVWGEWRVAVDMSERDSDQ